MRSSSSSSCAPPTTRRRRRSLLEATTAAAEAVGRGRRVLVFTSRRIGAVVFVALYPSSCPVEIHAAGNHNNCFVRAFSSSSSLHRRPRQLQQYEPRFLTSNFEAAAAAAASSKDDLEQDGIGNGHDGNVRPVAPPAPIRLNKVLSRTHSRRSADRLIQEGRVTVNGAVAVLGAKVDPAVDEVKVDGLLVPPDLLQDHDNDPKENDQVFSDSLGGSASSTLLSMTSSSQQRHEYVKYWKPVGVTCTCDVRVPGNLVEALLLSQTEGRHGGGGSSYGRRRLFPVGRLDRDTSGLLLLTSDGRLPNAMLKSKFGHPKTYQVTLDRPIDPIDVDRLQRGVIITTETSRPPPLRQALEPDRRSASAPASSSSSSYRRRAMTARTRPAQVGCDDPQHHPNRISVTVTEGRNRLVRKMVGAVGYTVVKLHRTSFLAIGLDGLEGPGDFAPLNKDEMGIIHGAIRLHHDESESSRTPN